MTATTLLFADNASTVLASSITAAATTCTLAPGTGALFPNPGANQAFPMSFVDAATGLLTEIVLVTARSGDTITTMVRGQEGTAARAWLAADLANCFWTAGALGAGAMAQIGPLQQGTYGYAVDNGSANAIVLTMTPAITSYVDGFPINFKAAANNTGATTININGVGAVALQGAAGALQGGEIVAGKTYEGNYNATSSTFVLLGQGGGAEQIAPATASQHAVQLGQLGNAGVVPGRLLRVTVYRNNAGTLQSSVNGAAFASASSTFTSLAATSFIVAKVGGGGGAGGGAPVTGASQISAGAGGGAGGYAEGVFTSGFSTLAVTVGAGGVPVAGAAGGNGGTSSLGALTSATGGAGGIVGSLVSTGTVGSNGNGPGGIGSGGQINASGGPGLYALFLSSGGLSGKGGDSPLGGGAPSVGPSTSAGSTSSGYSAGGSGGACLTSAGPAAGGSGLGGCVIVSEYA